LYCHFTTVTNVNFDTSTLKAMLRTKILTWPHFLAAGAGNKRQRTRFEVYGAA